MQRDGFSRRNIAAGIGAVVAGLSAAGGARANTPPADPSSGEVTRTHAEIHQEIAFMAGPSRVYDVLTSTHLFDRVARRSGAMTSMKAKLGSEPTRIDARPGGAFALFGGYISGFNLELVPGVRLVQAWRVGSWTPGVFSIARFALSGAADRTTVVFDHTGFPDAAAEHLAQGWHLNYWDPLAKVLREAL